MLGTLDFLRHILPDEGHHAAFTLETRRHFFTRSLDELAVHILRTDAVEQTVYHACASFIEPTKRTQDNAHGAKSFWLDIDAGPGKGYVDAIEAFQAVKGFCDAIGIPPPLYVGSGSGLHCYWPLASCLDPQTWKRYAEGLKALCWQFGLEADPARTADISSILRTPGTHNRKTEDAILVQWGGAVGPYAIEAFEVLLNAAPEQKEKPRYVNGHSLVGKLSKLFQPQSPNSGGVVAECQQVRLLRTERGNVPEPHWYAVLGVLAYCGDGDAAAHAWSEGYDGYTYEETQARLDRARTLSGATTCAHFHSLDPKTCEACPHWQKIKSPITLGYDNQSREETARVSEAQVAGIPLPDLPYGYKWTDDGALVFKSSKSTDDDYEVLISTHSIYLHGVQTGEVRGDFNYLFKQFIPQRGWGDVAVPASVLFSSGGAGELAKQGANIHDHQHFTKYVKHAIDMQYTSGTLNTKFEQFGWKNDDKEFLYGLTLYGRSGKLDVSGSDELQVRTNKRNEWVGPYSRGSLDAWTRAANSLFAAGCEAQSLSLLASFAAPLMRFQAGDEGGAIVSLVTRKSGTGKSTALAGAASVWGKREGLGLTNADSKISKFLTLGALGNLPLVYDEIETKDPKIISDFVENFTNGRDKMRATRTGSIAHTASTWQTVLISASNASLIDAMSTGNDIPALGRRILELPLVIPDTLKHAIGDKLQQELTNNRGHAGDAYLTWLVQPDNLAWTKKALEQWTAQVWEQTKLGPDYRFWVRLAGAVAVSGTIVSKLGLLEFSPKRIMDWLLGIMKEKGTVAAKASNDDWPIHTLGDFLNHHSQNTLTMPGPHTFGSKNVLPILKHTRELMIRYEIQGRRYLIAMSPLRDWLVRKQISFNEMARLLIEMGVCTDKARYATLAAGTDYPSSRVLCIEIDAAHEKLQGKVPTVSDNVVSMAR